MLFPGSDKWSMLFPALVNSLKRTYPSLSHRNILSIHIEKCGGAISIKMTRVITKEDYQFNLKMLEERLQDARAKGEHDKAAMLKNDLTVWRRKVGFPFYQRDANGKLIYQDPEVNEIKND